MDLCGSPEAAAKREDVLHDLEAARSFLSRAIDGVAQIPDLSVSNIYIDVLTTFVGLVFCLQGSPSIPGCIAEGGGEGLANGLLFGAIEAQVNAALLDSNVQIACQSLCSAHDFLELARVDLELFQGWCPDPSYWGPLQIEWLASARPSAVSGPPSPTPRRRSGLRRARRAPTRPAATARRPL
jgi:hypothetical protein